MTQDILLTNFNVFSVRNKRFFIDRTFLRSKNIFFAKQKLAPAGAPQALFHVILRGGSLDWLKQACEYFYLLLDHSQFQDL